MEHVHFRDVELGDSFFESLKQDYKEFPVWFKKKLDEPAWIMSDENNAIIAFLYTKIEDGAVFDVAPPLPSKRRMKIGTMKILAHGTRLGERFIKKAIDVALENGAEEIYVTVFPKHHGLVVLYERYGFTNHGTKSTNNGIEVVLIKDLTAVTGQPLKDYPQIAVRNKRVALLAIYPEYHTRLFPDSILSTEPYDAIEDVSHTNSIHKIYVSSMSVSGLKPGDVVVIYRTSDGKGPARYRSVATSICVVEEVRSKQNFPTERSFVDYCKGYSVFSDEELSKWYQRKILYAIKMTYNVAFRRRLTRGVLIDNIGLDENAYWGVLPITADQLQRICKAGEIHEGLVIY